MEENAPRPFAEIPLLWRQLPHMNEAFFAAEAPHPSLSNTLLGVLLYTAIGTACVLAETLLRPAVSGNGMPNASRVTALLTGCLSLFITPVGFYLNTGINYLAALAFGGTGKFSTQAYLASLFIVPVGILTSVLTFLGLIPAAGIFIEWLLLLGVFLFTTILQIRMVRVAHRLSAGRAAAAVLVPLALIFGLISLSAGLVAVLVLAGPDIGSVFSSMNQPPATPMP